MWTENSQMFKLDLDKAEETEIKCQHLLGHRKSKRVLEKCLLLLLDYAKIFVWITTNWKIPKEMGIPDHLTCLLKNLYAGQEPTVRTGHGNMDWFQLGKEYAKAVFCHPAYLISMQSTSWEMLGWKKHKLESRLPGAISTTSDMQLTTPLWQKVKN